MILNLCLVPDKEFSKELILVSKEINSQLSSEYVVGKNSMPHATVLQFETSNEKESKELLKEIIDKEFIVNTKELYENISSHDNSWFGVEIDLNEELIEIQKRAVDLLNIDTDKIHNKLGVKFFPHFTTGMKPGSHSVNIKKENITNKEVKCEVKLGISAEHFTVTSFINTL